MALMNVKWFLQLLPRRYISKLRQNLALPDKRHYDVKALSLLYDLCATAVRSTADNFWWLLTYVNDCFNTSKLWLSTKTLTISFIARATLQLESHLFYYFCRIVILQSNVTNAQANRKMFRKSTVVSRRHVASWKAWKRNCPHFVGSKRQRKKRL